MVLGSVHYGLKDKMALSLSFNLFTKVLDSDVNNNLRERQPITGWPNYLEFLTRHCLDT